MIKVSFVGLDSTIARIAGIEKQLKFATAVALTRTANEIRDAMPAVMERELDRPTPFTKRGMFVTPARKDRLQAVVGFRDIQAKYLRWQIEGGERQASAAGIKLPGNIQLNTFGNIPRGLIDKLKRSAQDGTLGPSISKRLGVGNRRKGAAPIELFLGKPQGRGWDNAPMGIWRRVPGSPGKLIPVVLFDQKPVHYKPRFRFREAAVAVVRREWDKQFQRAFDEAMRSAR